MEIYRKKSESGLRSKKKVVSSFEATVENTLVSHCTVSAFLADRGGIFPRDIDFLTV